MNGLKNICKEFSFGFYRLAFFTATIFRKKYESDKF